MPTLVGDDIFFLDYLYKIFTKRILNKQEANMLYILGVDTIFVFLTWDKGAQFYKFPSFTTAALSEIFMFLSCLHYVPYEQAREKCNNV